MDSIDEHYQLRLAASAKYQTQIMPVIESLDHDPAMPDPHLLVETERSFYVTWSSPELEIAERSAKAFANTNSDLTSLVLGEFPAPTILPQTLLRIPPAAKRCMTTAEEVTPTRMLVRWERRGHDVAITPRESWN